MLVCGEALVYLVTQAAAQLRYGSLITLVSPECYLIVVCLWLAICSHCSRQLICST